MLKQIKYLLILLLFSNYAKAQKFDVDTIQYQGTTKNMVNLVILGDGYTQTELQKFEQDGKRFKDYFFSQHPFSRYKNFFNVFLIKVVSLESGAKHTNDADDCPKGVPHDSVKVSGNKLSTNTPMAISNPNNYFGSSFDNNGLHRLLVAKNQEAIRQVLKDNFPDYSQALIMVNSPNYGGSGGLFPTATTNVASNDIAIHELGHSFANLADEYWPGLQFLTENANRTQSAIVDIVPWKKWIGTEGIGIYSYGGETARSVWYRPHEYCKMQYLIAPFCAVCSEAIIEKIYSITNPIVKVIPAFDKPLNADSLKLFKSIMIKPDPSTLKIEWLLNGNVISAQIDSLRLDPGILTLGQNTLDIKVTDTTAYVRNQPKIYQSSWIINQEKVVELMKPKIRWGDTITTCYNKTTVLTVLNPLAGVTYKWYAEKNAKKSIATGVNFITEKLSEEKSYFLEANYEKKKSERKEVFIKIVSEIDMPEISVEVNKSSLRDTVILSVVNPNPDLNYKWFLNDKDLKSISYYRKNEQNVQYNLNRTGTSLKLPVGQNISKIYVEAFSKITTCTSKRKQIAITDK